MSEHGDPANGDLVEAAPPIDVPGEVADAVRTLIRWAGDDPDREGLLDTPKRVARAWRPTATALLFALPALGWSRLILQRHTPLEVALGTIIGAGAGAALYYL